jgi:hypothetical protein
MVTLAPGFESAKPFGGLGERIRARVNKWLGRAAIQQEVQPAAPYMNRIPGPDYTLTNPSAPNADLQAYYSYSSSGRGRANDWRQDPHADVMFHDDRPKPYMVQGNDGQARYETHAEKAARMANFHAQHPNANVLEAHSFEYSGELPGVNPYDAVNPYNPNSGHVYRSGADLHVGVPNPRYDRAPQPLEMPVAGGPPGHIRLPRAA